LFLGVFGADRFYLKYYVHGVFKMLSFGGLGIVYMFDLLLILFGFLGPADGDLFTERVN
jgi:TM2 domain-containing membrane protein YozV